MDEIEAFSPLRDDLPLLLCGDFNSTSAESVYELLTTGEATLSAPHDETVLSSFTLTSLILLFLCYLEISYLCTPTSPTERLFAEADR